MKEFKRYTVTAALPYTNGPVHIGHLAGVYLPADIYVRYLRAIGKDVIFICGSDEHGVAITLKARNEGISPQEVVDKYHKIIGDSFQEMGISFDIYHRTSSETHHQTASEIFYTLNEKGIFDVEETEQYYDDEAKQFLADRYIIGTCPNCGNPSAYGDQCENCGSTLNPTDLINPQSTLSGQAPILKKTKNWFLPLDKFQTRLEDYINSHSEWRNTVIGQCKSWLNNGLQARAMTRDLDWGIKVPLKDAEGKVLYVWFDAPIGYISATKELFNQNLSEEKAALYYLRNKNNAERNGNWEDYWKNDSTRLIHFIGKDNIVFHCLIFPAVLMAEGNYILPDNVPANEFLNLEGKKISTSRNWAVWLHEYLLDFPGRQDELRYVLTSIAPETKDSDFSWKDYQARVNNELVAVLGNFVNRVVVLTWKYYNGIVPELPNIKLSESQQASFNLVDDEFQRVIKTISPLLENFKFRDAQFELMNFARAGNKFLADLEPWKLIKEDSNKETVAFIMNCMIQTCANLTLLCDLFLPETAKKLRLQLNLSENWVDFSRFGSSNLIQAGHQINEAVLLFQKIEDAEIQTQIEKLETSLKTNSEVVEKAKDVINLEDFEKMDIRIGTILEAEKVAKTKKLLKLTVDTGIDIRTVVSGIAEHFDPEKIIGQQVSILVNLAPREIKGIVSQGMILMAENLEGKLFFVSNAQTLPPGSVIK